MSNDPDLIYRLEDCRDCSGTGCIGWWDDCECCTACSGTGEAGASR